MLPGARGLGVAQAYRLISLDGTNTIGNDAIYCPKDGSVFKVIEFGSTGIFDCHYDGEWPKGRWWTHDGGDLWPSRPVMYLKPYPEHPLKPRP